MLTITKRKTDYAVENQRLVKEAIDFLGWNEGFSIQVYEIYDYAGVTAAERLKIEAQLFDAQKDTIFHDLPEVKQGFGFRFHQVPGQYNENEVMTQELIQKLLGYEAVEVSHSRLFVFAGVSEEQVLAFKEYYLNPVENVEMPLDASPAPIHMSTTEELEPIAGFIDMTEAEVRAYSANYSMDADDMLVCHQYFKAENRNPNVTELKVIDTYWSDHCRHTTFNTEIDQIDIEEGLYKDLFQSALDDYLQKREYLNRTDRPVTLMDMGTIQAKDLMARGLLENVEVSAEINACALEIKVDVAGEEEDWILYFKNETHNHPTEIEPFGGASTCLGGGVRDPLSGRSWVYQAMRLSGAMNPNQKLEDVHTDKLPQRTISQQALAGYSDYANQIGVTGAYAEEIYHPGYEAKRMELGALISAAPRRNIIREEPLAGDIIVLLGGRTGRDGLGGAVGSSQIQTEESLETAGAEVQKGAPSVERKITRLFRNGDATALIKRCNDFGAGGVSVAVGELADGIAINLDAVPTKYDGMHGGEIALSESQERMAVVIAPENLEAFMAYAEAEDVEASIIAEVTDTNQITMTWNGVEIIRIGRDFLDSNGAPKHVNATLVQPQEIYNNKLTDVSTWSEADVVNYMTDLNRASQQAMAEQFDASIGRASVLFPYGGKYRKTKELGMVSRLPVENGQTTTTSGMAYGFHPDLAEQSPFHGGYYAVIESVSRMVALGFDYKDIRLTFQEFFESLNEEAKRWGKPVLALLGANTAMDALDLGSIGGKDSMSGTFEDLDVPPTLISFAIAPGKIEHTLSRAFKQAGSTVVLLENPLQADGTVNAPLAKTIYDHIHALTNTEDLLAASTVGFNGMLKELIEMSLGNGLGIQTTAEITKRLVEPMVGSFVLEFDSNAAVHELLDGLNFTVVGLTVEEQFILNDVTVDLENILNASEQVFDSVFETTTFAPREMAQASAATFAGNAPVETPRVLVPVLQGTNAEYDVRDAFQAAGFEVTQIVLANASHAAFEASIKAFIEQLETHHVLAIASGAVFGNQPNEISRAWKIIFKRDDVKQAVHQHLAQKHLIFGSGTGAAALIAAGLIEHGEITDATDIHVLPNKNGKFISTLVPAQVLSAQSAWSSQVDTDHYTTAVATAWGRIDLGNAAEKMTANGQVISAFTNYFAEENIDGLTSPNGLVFATLSNIERMDAGLFQNTGDVVLPPFIKQARAYFN